MPLELVIATQNKGKLKEIRELLSDLNIIVTSLADYPDAPEIIEDGDSFSENAFKKASIIAKYTNKLTMGEDSGIEIEALDNRPGIYSARYSGENATDETNNQKMIEELRGIPAEKRKARYCCSIALVEGDKTINTVSGQCEGFITEEPRGNNGFGYDPYFLIEQYQKTFGELDPSVKSRISHRANALKDLRKSLEHLVNA